MFCWMRKLLNKGCNAGKARQQDPTRQDLSVRRNDDDGLTVSSAAATVQVSNISPPPPNIHAAVHAFSKIPPEDRPLVCLVFFPTELSRHVREQVRDVVFDLSCLSLGSRRRAYLRAECGWSFRAMLHFMSFRFCGHSAELEQMVEQLAALRPKELKGFIMPIVLFASDETWEFIKRLREIPEKDRCKVYRFHEKYFDTLQKSQDTVLSETFVASSNPKARGQEESGVHQIDDLGFIASGCAGDMGAFGPETDTAFTHHKLSKPSNMQAKFKAGTAKTTGYPTYYEEEKTEIQLDSVTFASS